MELVAKYCTAGGQLAKVAQGAKVNLAAIQRPNCLPPPAFNPLALIEGPSL